MEARIYSGVTNAFLLDGTGTIQLPLGQSDWRLTVPVSVVFEGATSAVWTTGDVRGEATIALTATNSVAVASASYPGTTEVVWYGVTVAIVAWLGAALYLRSFKGAATQTVPDL